MNCTTAVLLCGGMGLRAWPITSKIPKPLIRLGGRELVYHVMDLLARQGITRFVLAAGYRHDLISEFVRSLDGPWQVDVVVTPADAGTWERLDACERLLDGIFLMTYADGIANVSLASLWEAHGAHRGVGTITVVPLTSPFGQVRLGKKEQVASFVEKPQVDDHYINAGFMMFSTAVFEHVRGRSYRSLEQEVLPAMAGEGILFAHRHSGFFRAVDTYKDVIEMDEMIGDGNRPWLDQVMANAVHNRDL